jgi:hypothetical protein
MKKFSWTAVALGASLALAGVNAAKADYSFDLTCSGNTCTTGGSEGTLTISENALDTQIIYNLSLSQGAIWDSGITTFFGYVTVGTGGSITNVTQSGTTAGTWTAGQGNAAAPGTFDGLASSLWNVWTNCSLAQGETNCGTTLTLTVDGTDLGIGFVNLPNNTTNFQVYAGLDVTCASNNLTASNTACAANSAIAPGKTGAVGATLSVSVPGPILGSGLPGLIAACAGLVAFARRRRLRFA